MTLKLYHAPHSRSSRIISQLFEMDLMDAVDIIHVTIPRQDGSGGRDPNNPHPEGKVPLLVHDDITIWESGAIMQYLTDLFPDRGFGAAPGDAKRGLYLSWLYYYGDVMEPVIVHKYAELTHPALQTTFRGFEEMTERLANGLKDQPFLLGDSYTAADLLVHSPFAWFADFTPDVPVIKDWVARCTSRDAATKTMEFDADLMAAA
ncbi:glutathione S-transferase family protein [Qingshengfaniella alkalisoli]|uniref:Glutathione S-transferase family protein n=1 Tax=Qingshengfaniella alkalisoli TaxID=2599296 RepID=A0A5B8IQ08_9RHOB|nr:glutathione S-transferase family protein [Qingshengfaniella alkalisoli]QDY68342.1 glutathione S-transferase family protein [Qingshengfaniella alkalisoli]